MKGYAIVGVVVAVALCGCSRGRPTQQEATSSTPTDNVDRLLTIAGCLVPGETTTQRTAARTSSSPPPPDFTLVDVTIPAGGAEAPSAVSGTSGAGEPASVERSTPRSYDLVADKDRLDDLQRFANSRVEVSGSIVAATGRGTPDVGAGSAPVGTQSSDVRRLRVKDVRQLEPTCGAAKKE
jgi:hypothetical protein